MTSLFASFNNILNANYSCGEKMIAILSLYFSDLTVEELSKMTSLDKETVKIYIENLQAIGILGENNTIKKRTKTKEIRVFPTMEEIREHAKKNGMTIEFADRFFHYYNAVEWIDKNKILIKQWKSTFATWVNRDDTRTEKINKTKIENEEKIKSYHPDITIEQVRENKKKLSKLLVDICTKKGVADITQRPEK